jgi:hypothetical protein
VIAWMRTQSGSTSLRALVYIDEVFGMFPPTANPPTKAPILSLLKQGRGYGLGLVVATQNPKDIDYKGLANAGTWFIGKMQTDNDRARVLEGLDSARDATSTLDVKSVSALIGSLGPREFILHDIHKPQTPILISSRWSMSFLRGPLTRQQIGLLMANQRSAPSSTPVAPQYPSMVAPAQVPPAAPVSAGSQAPPPPQVPGMSAPAPDPNAYPAAPAPVPPTYSGTPDNVSPPPPGASPALVPLPDDTPTGFSSVQPALPSSIYQFFLPTEYTVEQSIRNWEQWSRQPAVQVETRKRLLYRPALLAQMSVTFNHKPTNSIQTYYYAFVVPNLPHTPLIDWVNFQSEVFDPHSLDPSPFAEAYYSDVPPTLARGTGFRDLQGNLVDWLSLNTWLIVYFNPTLKQYSSLDESQRDFQARIQAVCRQERDKEIDTVSARYDTKIAALEARAATFQARVDQKQDELSARKQEETLSAGESLLGMMQGRSERILSRATRLRRYSTTAQDRLGIYDQNLQNISTQVEALQSEVETALQGVQDKWVGVLGQIQEVKVMSLKKDITPQLFGVGWVPYWDVAINGSAVILPASSSGLSSAQE